MPDIKKIYLEYIQSLREFNLDNLSDFVDEDVVHNNRRMGIEGYKGLIRDGIVASRLAINVQHLISDEDHVAAHLIFTCPASTKELLGKRTDGTEFSLSEIVMYKFRQGKIIEVHSVVDVDGVKSHMIS